MIGDGPRQQWRNLSFAAGAAAAVLFAAWDLYLWVQAYVSDHFHNDFTFYVAAARIGISRGWPSIYDLAIQQAELDAMGSHITIAQLARYISPPPLAWLAVPLAPQPYELGYWVWSGLLLAALTGTWYLAAPGSGPWRLVHLAAAIGWLPVIFGLQLGQPPVLVALGVAACYALLRAGRPFWAGMALGALVLKPQLAFLLPMALLVSGRIRAFLGSVVALGCLAAASALALGPNGISTYQGLLTFAATVPVNQELTLAPFVGNLAATRVIQVVLGLWALFLAFQLRKRGREWVLIPALVGGMLATPYLHLDDLAMLGLAAWLYLRTSPPAWTLLLVLGLVIAVEAVPFVGPLPLIAGELGVLVLLSVTALKADDRDPEHHQPESQDDARLERDREHVAVDGQR
ncbi:MAG: hypothetical protein NVS9B11_00200 [Candidatus Dormibacteraceae bacterium]